VTGILLGVFIYWGWDSGVAVNEESEDPNEGPGRAAVVSTVLLLVIYVVVSAAAQAFHGPGFLAANEEDVLSALGKPVLGGVLYKLLIVAVLTSASASTQTTILPTARTTLSMACWKSIPSVFSRVHARYLTPTWSTIGMGAISIAVTVPLLLTTEHVLVDSIIAIGFPICFYYGFTGVACAVYYRHQLLRSFRDFVLLGLAPLAGGLILFGVFGKALDYYNDPENAESGRTLGFTLPIWIGVGGLVLGIVLMLVSRPFFREYFSRRLETARPGVLEEPVEHAPAHF